MTHWAGSEELEGEECDHCLRIARRGDRTVQIGHFRRLPTHDGRKRLVCDGVIDGDHPMHRVPPVGPQLFTT